MPDGEVGKGVKGSSLEELNPSSQTSRGEPDDRGRWHGAVCMCGLHGSSLPEGKPKERSGTYRKCGVVAKGRGGERLSGTLSCKQWGRPLGDF